MSAGLFDADLGGNVYKKRVAMGSKGRRAGYRTIVGAVIGDKYFFLYAFAKNARANINAKEKLALKELAKKLEDKFYSLLAATDSVSPPVFIVGGANKVNF